MTRNPIEARFLENLRRLGADPPNRFLVALSGGLDSTVLLHLLRFNAPPGLTVSAAHFDHAMRPESAADAAWVATLCREWNVPLESGQAASPLRGETAARDARYAFLRAAAEKQDASHIVTAHHADDQAETVLFRILRGTGIEGLAGIAGRTRAGLLRPLLPFWREELAEYASRHGLQWREDATNATSGPLRNRLRLDILPRIEGEVAPTARQQLISLASIARETEQAMRPLVAAAQKASVRRENDVTLVSRSEFRTHDPAIQSRLVRHLLNGLGVTLSRAGTRRTVAFITDAQSGRELELPGGVTIRIEFDLARIGEASGARSDDAPLAIALPGAGAHLSASLRLGGTTYRVEVTRTPLPEGVPDQGAIWREVIPAEGLVFPLLLRGRRAGDAIGTAGGTKSLKKLMIERRVPQKERSRRPVLADAGGRVIWVAGICMAGTPHRPGQEGIEVAIYHG